MSFIIDGHNLIPCIQGMSLDQMDDELRLIDILESYFRSLRKRAVIFFDGGKPGEKSTIKRAFVTARFIHQPLNADQAIRNQLMLLGGSAKNYTVVSSDNEIVTYVKRLGAHSLSSQEFAKRVKSFRKNTPHQSSPDNDVDFWLEQFNKIS